MMGAHSTRRDNSNVIVSRHAGTWSKQKQRITYEYYSFVNNNNVGTIILLLQELLQNRLWLVAHKFATSSNKIRNIVPHHHTAPLNGGIVHRPSCPIDSWF
jgi:hypothetical protein